MEKFQIMGKKLEHHGHILDFLYLRTQSAKWQYSLLGCVGAQRGFRHYSGR